MTSLVVRRAALGDFVLTLPVIRALAALGPVHVATHMRYSPLLPAGATLVDDAWSWRGAPPPVRYAAAFAFGTVAADALAAAGVAVRAVAPRPPPGVHAVDHYAGVLEGLALQEPFDRVPRVGVGAAAPAVASATAALDGAALAAGQGVAHPPPLVVLAPGSGGRDKRWPIARFRALAAALAARGALPVWVRGPDEADEDGWPADAACPNLPGLMALAARCAAWVGPDSGPSHLAAAVRAGLGTAEGCGRAPGRGDPRGGVTGGLRPPVPKSTPAEVHVIFGPTDPVSWAPVGATVWSWDVDPIELAEAIHRV